MLESREPRVAILGVAIDNLTMDQVLDALESQIAEGGFHQIATANVDFVMNSVGDEELREVLNRCDIVLADGMPLVWASRLLGVKLKERVTGADLVPRLTKLSAERGYRIFLLGASEESSKGTAAWMQRNFPRISIAGRHCPRVQALEEMDHEKILAQIEEAHPDVLLVAFGNPKQEKWLAMHRNRLKVPVCIGVGGAFDFLSGRIRRAPLWMQTRGLEWLYRTIQEPSRLAGRYFRNAMGLLRYMPGQLMAMAAQARKPPQVEITEETIGPAKVHRISGCFTGTLVLRFESDVSREILAGSHIVLDLSETSYIGADALGTLVHLLSLAHRWKRELWLTGLRRFLRRILHAARLNPAFRIATHVAEALRRIEPEPAEVPLFYRIGEKLASMHTPEMLEVERQIRLQLQRRLTAPLSLDLSDVQQPQPLMKELLPQIPDEMTTA